MKAKKDPNAFRRNQAVLRKDGSIRQCMPTLEVKAAPVAPYVETTSYETTPISSNLEYLEAKIVEVECAVSLIKTYICPPDSDESPYEGCDEKKSEDRSFTLRLARVLRKLEALNAELNDIKLYL